MRKGSYISQRVLRKLYTNNDIVSTFFDQCIEKVSTFNLSKPNMYSVFARFCKAKESSCRITYDQFFRQIRRLYPEYLRVEFELLEKMVDIERTEDIRFSEYGKLLLDEIIPKGGHHNKGLLR